LDLDGEKEEEWNERTTSTAFVARSHQKFNKNYGGSNEKERACFGCGKPGHIKRKCITTGPECYKCGERGHLERECKKESSTEKAFTATLAFTVLNKEGASEKWILDSGSLIHVCNQQKMFENLQAVDQREELWGISGEVKVAAYGEVLVNCKLPDGGVQKVRLKNVAYVPEARVNIISVSCLIKKGVSLQMDLEETVAVFQKQVLLTAKKEQGLFIVQTTWKHTKQQTAAEGVMEKERKPKPEEAQATGRAVLEVVHLYVSTDEKKTVTLVDDVSKVSIVQPIEQLSEVEKIVPVLIDKLKRQSWKRVKKVAVKGNFELRGQAKEFCQKKGFRS
jgi:hypothetical protein